MAFSISAYVSRSFLDLSMEAVDRLADVLTTATAAANRDLPHDAGVLTGGRPGPFVEVGPLRIGPARASEAWLHWWSSDRQLVADGVLRMLPVEGGASRPMTELLLQGAWSTEAARGLHPVGWARRVLDLTATTLATPASMPAGLSRAG